MGLIAKILRRSPKIKVSFYDYATNNLIGQAEMPPEQLPETFALETKLTLKGSEWMVKEATPIEAADFIKSKRLILKMTLIEAMNLSDLLFTVPSISNELPATTNNPLFNGFEITIHEDEWRQKEFLPLSAFSLVNIEIAKIGAILENNSTPVGDNTQAYTNCHVRDIIGEPNLSINFDALKKLLNVSSAGSLSLINNDGFVQDGFTLTTGQTTFYGILEDDTVTQLCIGDISDGSFTEIQHIVDDFGLVFVNWYNCEIITEYDH